MRNNKIMLSGRKYTIQDIGDGPPCILLTHRHSKAPIPLSMLTEQISGNYRLIILDITAFFSINDDTICPVKLDNLIEDLHLLCDIYWLDKVALRSDFQSELIQFKFKAQLSERYQSDWDLNFSQPEEQRFSLH